MKTAFGTVNTCWCLWNWKARSDILLLFKDLPNHDAPEIDQESKNLKQRNWEGAELEQHKTLAGSLAGSHGWQEDRRDLQLTDMQDYCCTPPHFGSLLTGFTPSGYQTLYPLLESCAVAPCPDLLHKGHTCTHIKGSNLILHYIQRFFLHLCCRGITWGPVDIPLLVGPLTAGRQRQQLLPP